MDNILPFLLIIIASLFQGSFGLGMKYMNPLKWESWWVVHVFIAMVLFPIIWTFIAVPESFAIIDQAFNNTNSEVVNETTETSVEENADTSVTRKVKNQEIELPPKREKIELQEFKKPEIICNCSNGEICIECAE